MKKARRNKSRARTIEALECRQVMSADPLTSMLGGSIQHHVIDDVQEELPALVHHRRNDADFWLDPSIDHDVESLVGEIEQMLSSAHNSTGLTQVRNDYGFIGTGQTVAIVDSGIAWDHYALGGGFGPNYRVVGGWDFTEENDSVPYDDGPAGYHGTHVAGIVGADRPGTSDDGVTPGADLISLRVFNDQGDGYFSWVENALSWIHTNRNSFDNPITAVNLSLGTSWNSTSLPPWATLEDEFAQLKADGIFITVSAGNSFSSYNEPGLSYPAASPHVVPVMSVNDNGGFSGFSQRHPTAIGAPGRSIVSTIPDHHGNQNGVADDFASLSGTSMAAPYVAGASVILREAMQFVGYTNITQDTIYDHIMATATEFYDSATDLNYKRLNLTNALDALMPSDDFGSTIETAYNLGTLNNSTDIAGLIGKLNDVDYFTFTAGATGSVDLSLTGTHGLQPSVAVSGSNATYIDGTWSFEVIAGQTYSFSLATEDGIGYFDVELSLSETFQQPVTVLKTIVRSDGVVFSLDSQNWLSVNGSRIWQGTRDFTLGADETLYWQSIYGLLEHRMASGQWMTLDVDSIKFEVADDGTVYSLADDGWLSVNGSNIWNNTQDFALGADQTLYWQATNGLLQHRHQDWSWQDIGYGVSKFTVRDNGVVYSLGNDNWMKVDGSSIWQSTKDFLFTDDQSLYWLSTGGLLERLPNNGSWTTLGMGVSQFAIRQDGALYCLLNNGNLVVDGVQQWSNVSSMSLDNTGSLVIDRSAGSDSTVYGRFKISAGESAQASSTNALTAQTQDSNERELSTQTKLASFNQLAPAAMVGHPVTPETANKSALMDRGGTVTNDAWFNRSSSRFNDLPCRELVFEGARFSFGDENFDESADSEFAFSAIEGRIEDSLDELEMLFSELGR